MNITRDITRPLSAVTHHADAATSRTPSQTHHAYITHITPQGHHARTPLLTGGRVSREPHGGRMNLIRALADNLGVSIPDSPTDEQLSDALTEMGRIIDTGHALPSDPGARRPAGTATPRARDAQQGPDEAWSITGGITPDPSGVQPASDCAVRLPRVGDETSHALPPEASR